MSRAILILAILVCSAGGLRPSQDVYPPLTRETLIGTWQGLAGIGSIPTVFHVVIAARDSDSYLSEIYPQTMTGRLFRLESCSVAEGKVTLHFTESGGSGWWIVGEGYGDRSVAWINARLAIPNKPDAGPPTFYLAKGTWVRDIGEAARRAAEKIPKQ